MRLDTAIQRLTRKILKNAGTRGKAVLKSVHLMLWTYAQSHDEVTTTDSECPELDPNCDPPGNGKGGG